MRDINLNSNSILNLLMMKGELIKLLSSIQKIYMS